MGSGEKRAMGVAIPTDGRSELRWTAVLESAQAELAQKLARSIAIGGFGHRPYLGWLGLESAACRLGVLSLDAVARWHGHQVRLREAAKAWGSRLHALAQAAEGDAYALGGSPLAPQRALLQWQAFISMAAASQRAGEVLGGALLQTHLSAGPVRPLLAAIARLPDGLLADRYVQRRLMDDVDVSDRDALLDAYAQSALAVGARRAAGWYAAALRPVLTHQDAPIAAGAAPPQHESTP
ncbi:MAG TPA: hypothetical protein VM619_11250 [Luteimonas sp.]|nr:hypothetical protein [Luteimonas sp.]